MPRLDTKVVKDVRRIMKGDALLEQICANVTQDSPEVYDCIDEMKNTLRNCPGFWNEKGLAICAPQVGVPLRMFIHCHYKNWYTPIQYRTFQTVINPEITASSDDKVIAWEGCLSQDEKIQLVERPAHIKVQF